MSKLVREWLARLGLLHLTTHEDRLEIDREIEIRTGYYCDDAIAMGLISEEEFLEIVQEVIERGKKRKKRHRGLVIPT